VWAICHGESLRHGHTCSDRESGTSPQELVTTCTSCLRHQSMHMMACSLLPLPFASMNRQATSDTALHPQSIRWLSQR
jgi:hypothetical protein